MNWLDKVDGNIFEMPNRLKYNGRARLLPSLARPWFGRSLTLPSIELVGPKEMNWLDKVDEDMFTGLASPSR